jgi:hypothetical protein
MPLHEGMIHRNIASPVVLDEKREIRRVIE